MRHIPYVTPFTSSQQSRAHILLEEPSWQQLSYVFVFVLFWALKKRIPLKICILSCCFLLFFLLLNKRSVEPFVRFNSLIILIRPSRLTGS